MHSYSAFANTSSTVMKDGNDERRAWKIRKGYYISAVLYLLFSFAYQTIGVIGSPSLKKWQVRISNSIESLHDASRPTP